MFKTVLFCLLVSNLGTHFLSAERNVIESAKSDKTDEGRKVQVPNEAPDNIETSKYEPNVLDTDNTIDSSSSNTKLSNNVPNSSAIDGNAADSKLPEETNKEENVVSTTSSKGRLPSDEPNLNPNSETIQTKEKTRAASGLKLTEDQINQLADKILKAHGVTSDDETLQNHKSAERLRTIVQRMETSIENKLKETVAKALADNIEGAKDEEINNENVNEEDRNADEAINPEQSVQKKDTKEQRAEQKIDEITKANGIRNVGEGKIQEQSITADEEIKIKDENRDEQDSKLVQQKNYLEETKKKAETNRKDAGTEENPSVIGQKNESVASQNTNQGEQNEGDGYEKRENGIKVEINQAKEENEEHGSWVNQGNGSSERLEDRNQAENLVDDYQVISDGPGKEEQSETTLEGELESSEEDDAGENVSATPQQEGDEDPVKEDGETEINEEEIQLDIESETCSLADGNCDRAAQRLYVEESNTNVDPEEQSASTSESGYLGRIFKFILG